MLLLRYRRASPTRRGAALLLALLVLIVIIMVTYQVSRTAGTDHIETNRSLVFTSMDYAIESAFLQVEEDLLADGDAGATGAGPGDGADPDVGGLGGGDVGGDPGAGEEGGGATDSQMDSWAIPASTTIGDRDLRILVVDEDRKFNVLGILDEDEEIAQQAFDIVVRILDNCREGTRVDIDGGEADRMARAMRDHFFQRDTDLLPEPELLSSLGEEGESSDRPVLPMSLRELVVLPEFEDYHFSDFIDEDDVRVHSIDAYLTMYTSPVIGNGTPDGGWAVNVNTAPLAVLSSLFDRSVVDSRIWDEVVLYRNEEEDQDPDEEAVEPALDEFGNEVIQKKIFDDLEELDEIPDFNRLGEEDKAEILERLKVDSTVFSVVITARQSTAKEGEEPEIRSRREREEFERNGTHLVRTVRRIYLRSSGDDSSSMIPLVYWDVLPYSPLEVVDFGSDDDF